jgi:hypothetical protein
MGNIAFPFRVVTYPGTPVGPQPTRKYGVIPIDPLNCWVDTAGDPAKVFDFSKFFDGDLTTRPLDDSTDQLHDSWAATFKFAPEMDVELERLRVYDDAGSAAGSGQPPVRIGYKLTPTSPFSQIGTFDGGKYNEWNDKAGSDADQLRFPAGLKPDQMRWEFDFRRVTLPTQLELIGWYTEYTPEEVSSIGTAAADVGVNSYGYELNTPEKLERYRGFKRVRLYMQRTNLRSDVTDPDTSPNGFNQRFPDQPADTWRIGFAYNGGLNFDQITADCKGIGMEVLACVMGADPEQARTWPDYQGDADTLPCRAEDDQHDPATWLQAIDGPEQVVMRLGDNPNVPLSRVKHATTPIASYDPPQFKLVGLNRIRSVGGVNEFNKPWKKEKSFFRPRAFMFYKSMMHDGHKGAFPGRGVKNISANIVHKIGGYYFGDLGHYLATVEEVVIERGLLPNGLPDVPWDEVDFHGYPNDAAGLRGMALELSPTRHTYRNFVKGVKRRTPQVRVSLNEFGYSLGPFSVQYVGETAKFDAKQRQAHLLVRVVELCVGYGIDSFDVYQGPDDLMGILDPNGTASDQRCGIMEPDDVTLRPAACWLIQRNLELDGWALAEIGNPQEDPNLPYWRRYTKAGEHDKYSMWVGNEIDATLPFTLPFPGKTQLRKITFQDTGKVPSYQNIAISGSYTGIANEQLALYQAV